LSQHSETFAILGAGGMLASAIEKTLKDSSLNYYSFSEEQLDITSHASLRDQLSQITPSIIINTAAYTDVDGCEENVELAFAVNAEGAENVARVSAELGAKLIHISTDYVFNGKKQSAYKPTDMPDPQSIYGKSKLEGETAIKRACDKYLILRTSWLFGPWGRNFVKTMLAMAENNNEIRVVDDQKGSPTYTMDLARALIDLAGSDLMGVHHLTNSGSCSWYEFAEAILKITGKNVPLIPVTTEEFPRPAERPVNSVLDCNSITNYLGKPLPTWQEAVRHYLKVNITF
jgi:dTDP-4-dehydrorhamnose reductase